jgi:hypothetical protein
MLVVMAEVELQPLALPPFFEKNGPLSSNSEAIREGIF